MLPWFRVTAILASLTNMRTKSGWPAKAGRIFFTTTALLMPAAATERAR